MTHTSVWKKRAADLSMVFVLIALCAYYSWATWAVQYAQGRSAAREVAKQIPQGAGGVLVVAQQGPDAEEFSRSLADLLAERQVKMAGIVTGQPSQLREKLDELAGRGEKFETVAATHEAAEWRLVQSLTGVKVLSPQPYHGPDFLTGANLIAIGDRIAVIAIIGIGMTMVILTGGIDLSVGSLIALCAVLVSRLIRDYGGGVQAGTGAMLLASILVVGIGAVAGAINGIMSTAFRVPPFIVTLAIMQIARGLAYEWSDGESINQVPASFVWLGRGRGLLGIPNTVILMGALYAVAQVVMSRMTIGRYIYAIGGNREAAFYAAVPVKRVLVFVYAVCGLLAGLGGIVEASRLQSGAPMYGQSVELSVIAAVVVGGASLTGGRGTILGTLIGALIIAVIETGMNLTRVGSYRQMVVLGCVTLGAVLVDQLRHRGRAS